MSRWALLSYMLAVAALFYPNGFLAIQHKIILTNLTTAAHPDLGNASITLADSKLSYRSFIFHNIENAIISAELNVKYNDYGPYTNFFKKRLNFCEFLANPNLDPLIYLGYKAVILDKRNHIFTECPIKAVRIIYILNIHLAIQILYALNRRAITTCKIFLLTLLMYRFQFTT